MPTINYVNIQGYNLRTSKVNIGGKESNTEKNV